MPNRQLDDPERRSTDVWHKMSEEEFRGFINRRLDLQDDVLKQNTTKLNEILELIKFGKIGAGFLKWLIAIGASAAAIFSAIHNWKV